MNSVILSRRRSGEVVSFDLMPSRSFTMFSISTGTGTVLRLCRPDGT